MSSASTSRRRPSAVDRVLPVATATVAAGVILTTLPLRSVFTDWGWLTTSVACCLPYWLIVALLRSRTAPHWWHSLAGLAGSMLMLLWVFVPQHLGYGVLPNPKALRDVGELIQSARTQMNAEHAPLASTHALRLLTGAALVLLAILTDLLAVLFRRPLLAAAPLLEVLAVASATSARAAHPAWFAGAAIGFLLILVSGTRLQDRAWGPSVDGSAGRLGGARRMAATGIIAALVIPVILPSVSVNLLARATHHDGDGTGGFGSGAGQAELTNFAGLRGSLKRTTAIDLVKVQVDPGTQPFYIRQAVLDVFTSNGWVASGGRFGQDQRLDVGDQTFPIGPTNDSSAPDSSRPATRIGAKFTVIGLGGRNLPLLANPLALEALPGSSWDSRTATVDGVTLQRNSSYSETAMQPSPSINQLRNAPRWPGSGDRQLDAQYLQLPTQPAEVTQLANRLTAGLGPYDAARAIADYFTNGKNGFRYSLDGPTNDRQAALVSFLNQKVGFCQQYAAAAAVLMRSAGLPARVVLGYTHRTPDAAGKFTVTTADAHAWVETYFESIGWISFDPTPLGGTEAGRAVGLPWAPHPIAPDGALQDPGLPGSSQSNRAPEIPNGGTAVAQSNSAQNLSDRILSAPVIVATLLISLLVVFAGPRLVRRRQRRRRLAIARTSGSPEWLWLELAATATDRGALWPATITVGQVPNWLAEHGVDEGGRRAVTAVAERVEMDRFSARPAGQLPEDFISALDGALTRWARREDRRQRLLHRWVPQSLIIRRAGWRR